MCIRDRNKMTYGYMSLALVVMLVRFTDFDISIVQVPSSRLQFKRIRSERWLVAFELVK